MNMIGIISRIVHSLRLGCQIGTGLKKVSIASQLLKKCFN